MQNLEPEHSLDRVEPNWKADVERRETRCLGPDDSPLSARQLAFIDDCLSTSDPIEVVMRRFALSTKRLAEWMANSLFNAQLRTTYESFARGRCPVVVGLQSPTWHRRAVLTLMRLSRDAQARELADRIPRPLDRTLLGLDRRPGARNREFPRFVRKRRPRHVST